MKRSIKLAMASGLTLLIFIVFDGCKEPAKKDMETAEENIVEAAKNLGKATKQTQEEIKTEIAADWERFKSESKVAIDNTETEIELLREKLTTVGEKRGEGIKVRLDSLEQKT